MIYAVSAKLKEEKAAEFLGRLSDGSIAAQKPDGAEMVDAMARARIGEDGLTRWSEICFCATPLKHERETVLDTYFSDFSTEEIDEHRDFEGVFLMEHLAAAG